MGFKKHEGNAVPVSSWAVHIIHQADPVCWPTRLIDPNGQVADKPCEDGRSTQTLTSRLMATDLEGFASPGLLED